MGESERERGREGEGEGMLEIYSEIKNKVYVSINALHTYTIQ